MPIENEIASEPPALPDGRTARPSSPSVRARPWAQVGVGLSIGLVVAATQFPFRFRLDKAHLSEKINEMEWEVYYTDRPGHVSIDRDLLQNVALFVPLGACLALAAVAPSPKRDTLRALAIGTALSVSVELLQLLTEARVTQLADVWRNALGAALAALVVSAVRSRKIALR